MCHGVDYERRTTWKPSLMPSTLSATHPRSNGQLYPDQYTPRPYKGCLGLLVNSSSTSKPPCTPLRLSPRLESLSSLDLGTVLPTVLSRAFQMNLRMILIATKGSLLFRPCRLSIEERGKLHLHATQVGQFPAILLGKRSVRTTATPAQQLERPLDGCYQHIGANPCRSAHNHSPCTNCGSF
ncbi:hypothetical protein SAICODRAFT_129503 [Saitoella complicata NRRL Y-17804]|uniref:uncharacterized protein n=1 Tax=Saitoella complicata (strain BCRC 22490 / CBS 7301 / JCM 7358 / NBRC 10748 / NRRL Y-17804) TaxID=698492 RepID=UPI0008682602|nr:uncharacterized protein SAICODRAFT_129503 [Saitoella complicata NRRL Y-17804]ODQ52481.1 hypothetical protein SAICODRAFT_129503 [Saitoella complicata NRRL Y-17804]